MAIFKGGKGRDDHFSGTDENDRFLFAAADLTINDGIIGRGGFDRLIFTTPGDVSSAGFVGVSGIEQIELADGGMFVSLMQQLVDLSSTGGLTVIGGAGADEIRADSLNVDGGSIALTLRGGDGKDLLVGGSGRGYLLNGGAGLDTVRGQGGIVVYDPEDRSEAMGGDAVLRVAHGGRFDLARVSDQSLSDRCVTSGFSLIDASGSQVAISVRARFYDTVIGGAGADTIVGAGQIAGGRGADHLVGSTETPTTFILNAGDFVAGEVITGHGSDALLVTASTDLRLGRVSGISQLAIVPAAGRVAVTMSGDQAAELWDVHAESGTTASTSLAIVLASGDVLPSALSIDGVVVTVVGSDAGDAVSVGSIVLGNGGDDVIDAPGTVFGGDGDDRIIGPLDIARTLNGGAGTDTFVLVDYPAGVATISIDLSGRTQDAGVATILRNFENFDGSAADANPLHVTGSAVDNTIIGGKVSDVLAGGLGDDVLHGGGSYYGTDQLNGGAGDDVLFGSFEDSTVVMTGGAGADTFRWTERVDVADRDTMDQIVDFKPGTDHLEFYANLTSRGFGYTGDTLDQRIVANSLQTDITHADLVIFTGGRFDSKDDVAAYLDAAAGGDGSDVFIVGRDSSDHTVVFYSTTAEYGSLDQIDAIADLGVGVKPGDLTLADFVLVNGFPGS